MLNSGTAAAVKGLSAKLSDGGRRFVASEPVEKSGEDGQRDADRGGVARVVEVADRQSEVVESGHGAALFGLESGQNVRQDCRVGAVAAVVSDHQTPAQGVNRRDGICVAESETVGPERQRRARRVAGCLGSLDEAIRGSHRLLTGTADCQCDDQACRVCDVGVAAACELGAAQLDQPLGLADEPGTQLPSMPSMPYGSAVAATAENDLAGVAVADSRLDPSGP